VGDRFLHDIGTFGREGTAAKLQLVNLCTDEAGNRALPSETSGAKTKRCHGRAGILLANITGPARGRKFAAFVAVFAPRAARSSSTAPRKRVSPRCWRSSDNERRRRMRRYFADGPVRRASSAWLTHRPGIKRCRARTSSFYFKGQARPRSPTLRRRWAFAARFWKGRRAQVRQTRCESPAQLIRVDNGYHVWSETYDRKLDDIFQVQG